MHALGSWRCARNCAAVTVLFVMSSVGLADELADSVPQTLWDHASALEERGLFAEAAIVYADILADFPQSQRAAVMLGVNELEAGRAAAALIDLDHALAMDPFSRDWAERGYLSKAKAHQQLSQIPEAEQAIEVLEVRFPDSFFAAEAAIIDASLAGEGITTANDALDSEIEAKRLYDAAVSAKQRGEHQLALRLLDQTIDRYPETHTALRAMEDEARLLETLPDSSAHAIVAYEDLLNAVLPSWPHSRIRYQAEQRLAALDSSADRKGEAIDRLKALANGALDESVVASAAEQAAQIELKLLQEEQIENGEVSSGTWRDVRAMSAKVTASARPSVDQLARAGLWLVESLCWEGMSEEAVASSRAYLAVFDTTEHRQGVASVRFLMGEELLRLGRYQEALEAFEAILTEYAGEQEIWSGMDHMPRVYFRVWETLRRLGAPAAEIEAAADALLRIFPESPYADHIRIVMQEEEE